MNYTAQDYPVQIWYSVEDKGFIAQVLDMSGISAFGETREEAAREIGVVLELVLKIDQEDGTESPVPGSYKTRKIDDGRKSKRINKLYVIEGESITFTGTRDKPLVHFGTAAKSVSPERSSVARRKSKSVRRSTLIR